MESKKQRATVYLSGDLLKKLKHLAVEQNTSVSILLEKAAIEVYFKDDNKDAGGMDKGGG